MTPHGTWRSYWAIVTGILYQNSNLPQQYRQIQRLIWIVTLGSLIFILANGLLPNSQSGEDSLNIAIIALLWSGLLWINAIQSMILSSLIGLVVGSNTRTHFDGQMLSVASFISLQALSYGSVILLIGYLPLLIDNLNIPILSLT